MSKLMPTVEEFELMQRMASVYASSGLFKLNQNKALALTVILKAWGMGIPVTQAFEFFHIMGTKISVSANGQAFLLKRAGYDYVIKELTNEVCCLVIHDKNGETLGISCFSQNDAAKAGLNSANWSNYPRNMLFARAISNALSWYAPDATGGVSAYTEDELSNGVSEIVPVIDDMELDLANEPITSEIVETLEAGLDIPDAPGEFEISTGNIYGEQTTDERLDHVSAVPADDAQALAIVMGKVYGSTKDGKQARLDALSTMTGREITSTKELTTAEHARAVAILETLKMIVATVGKLEWWHDCEVEMMKRITGKDDYPSLWNTQLGHQSTIRELFNSKYSNFVDEENAKLEKAG